MFKHVKNLKGLTNSKGCFFQVVEQLPDELHEKKETDGYDHSR